MSPAWENQSEIISVILTNNGKRIARFHIETGKYEPLTDFDMGDVKHLKVDRSYLYFISDYSGKDAVYRMNLETREIEKIYNPRFGAAYPEVDESENLLLSDYTANGFRLIKVEDIQPVPLNSVEKADYALANKLASQEIGVPDLSVNDTLKYASETYSKPAHILNFHSWAPVFVDPYQYDFAPGVSFMSQNVLGTAETVLGYKWDLSEETGKFYASYIYKGWYPVLDFEFTSGNRASQYNLITDHVQNGNVVYSDTVLTRFTWKETRLSSSVKLPLNLTRSKFFRLLQPEIRYEFTHTNVTESTPSAYPVGDYHSVSYRLYFHQLLRQSHQDVWPNFGFIIDGSYYHSPFGNLHLGSAAGIQGIVYLPGLLANHGFKAYVGTQNRTYGDHYSYSDIIRFPRGWAKVSTKDLSTIGIDYKMPLLNPDLSLGGLAFIRRINTTFFYDYGNMSRFLVQDGHITGTYTQSISSFGVEVLGDMNFLRFYAPVQIGFRASYLPEIKNSSLDFLISVDFNSL